METHCLRYTDIPGISRLFREYIYNFDLVSGYYDHNPYDPASYAAAAGQIQYPDSRRAALVAALRKINRDSPSLESLARPGTVAVVTGQQAGLFSGPAYTIYKALTAVRLAQELTRNGIPAVPVFWIATEDHDFAEVNHTHVFTYRRQAITLRTEGEGAPDQPVGGIRLPSPPVSELLAALAEFPYGDAIGSMVRAAYPDGVTAGEGFRRLLDSLLGKFGLLYLDPLEPSIREIAAPFLERSLAESRALNEKVRERSRELEQNGHHAQVLVEDETSLLFLLDGNHRVPLRRRNGGLVAGGRLYSEADLSVAPEKLSPNALLRPVMQDYLLPTVAYIGGGAEVAYLAQSQVIYHDLLGRMPVILPRASFTLIDPLARRQMNRYAAPLPSFFESPDAVRQRLAKTLVPPELLARYAAARKSQQCLLDRLRRETLAFDPTLAKALDKSKAKMEYQLQKIERKVAAQALRRDEQAARDTESLLTFLYPEKHLQERYYSILPFLAEFGPGLLDELYGDIHPDCPDHKIGIV